ncbi:MAG TPA: DNA-directed RNA polymerase subunit N [Candidatus Nanoarchaeia archaeon]|nr:DNA-directed RNA polymerase subunit N [Candidatus Nanoarchaeia archaeon]
MIIPIRCFSCGKPIGHLWEEFKKRVKDDSESAKKVLDELGLERYCCRSVFLSQEDYIELISKFKKA